MIINHFFFLYTPCPLGAMVISYLGVKVSQEQHSDGWNFVVINHVLNQNLIVHYTIFSYFIFLKEFFPKIVHIQKKKKCVL